MWVAHVGLLRRHILRAKDTHDHGAGSVGTLVLGEVVRSGELLAAVGALEGLLVGVERAVVALEMFLAAEAAVAKLADEGLAGVLGERLLATPAAGGLRRGRSVVLGTRRHAVVVVGTLLAGCTGLCVVAGSLGLLARLTLTVLGHLLG